MVCVLPEYRVEGAAARGGKSISVWDDLTLRTPNLIEGGTNGNVACDMYNRYKEDIKLMKQMGFDSYRFSISWPRILPGMIPFVTLFHWDLPNCLQLEYGGMLSDKIVNDFVEYAELCFQEFGDRVKFWATINEPWTYAVRDKDSYTVARNLLLCHSAAVKSYRTDFKVLEPVIHGQYPESMLQYAESNIVPFSNEEKKSLRNLLIGGLNYYTSYFVAYEQNPPGVGYPADQQIMFSYTDKDGNPVGEPDSEKTTTAISQPDKRALTQKGSVSSRPSCLRSKSNADYYNDPLASAADKPTLIGFESSTGGYYQ
ncbi:Raucaffricine-O-beta-D-glucosidase [Sesamum angolense]|uniref:Raucaffricine-O-beta-D-glucosidase n=1 Tax=Sesamum angolense TaxID=2727404 RepID=A0AAE1WJQ9_9LAMI|nr:Raucaffricine-O-beta-D-glucosidase [Sesamum angolense]